MGNNVLGFQGENKWVDIKWSPSAYYVCNNDKELNMDSTNITYSGGEVNQAENFKIQSNEIKKLIQRHGLETVRSLVNEAKQQISTEDQQVIVNELARYFRIRDKLKKTTDELEII